METNTVVLKLSDYQKLLDFKRNIEAGKIVRCFRSSNYHQYDFINADEAMNIMDDINKNLKDDNEKLKKEYNELLSKYNDINNKHNGEITKLKQMSIFEFLKFRKS